MGTRAYQARFNVWCANAGQLVFLFVKFSVLKKLSLFGIQQQYQCCGKDSPQDYLQDDDDVLPPSCCRLQDCSDDYNIFTKGCLTSAVKFVDDHSDYLILCLVAGVALEVRDIYPRLELC